MSLLMWHLPTAQKVVIAIPCLGEQFHTTQMMPLSSLQALLRMETLVISSSSLQQNMSYNWLVTLTSLLNIQVWCLPSVEDAGYVRKHWRYTKMCSIQFHCSIFCHWKWTTNMYDKDLLFDYSIKINGKDV